MDRANTGRSLPFSQAHGEQRHYAAQNGTAKQAEGNTHFNVANLISYRHAKHQSYYQALLNDKQGDQLTLIHTYKTDFSKFSNKGTTKGQCYIKPHNILDIF